MSHSGPQVSPPLGEAVVALAECQWGVVTLGQLRALGVSTYAARHWLRRGRLRPLHRGVYALGHAALRAEGRWLAAVLACGDDAVLSHRSAAALWGLRSTAAANIDVTAPRSRGSRDGISVHRSRRLTQSDVTVQMAIPVTSVPRTLLDLSVAVSLGDLESATATALRQRLTDTAELESALGRHRGHRGIGKLAATIAGDPKVTRSQLERRFLALVRRARLPEPETNVWMSFGAGEEWQIDALWRDRRVTVELDSWRFHGDRRSFEADRARAATLTAAGYRHLQLTWRQVTGRGSEVARTLAALLGADEAAASRGGPS